MLPPPIHAMVRRLRRLRCATAPTTAPAAALLALVLGLGSAGSALALPSFEQVRSDFQPSDTLILARDGEELQRLRTDMTVRRGRWTALAEVSPALRSALVLSEDRRFWQHSGIDWAAVSAAAWGNLFNQRTRGASTISMQLAGLLEDGERPRSGQRGVLDKMEQAVSGQVLDRRWHKDQVLEAYLNLVPFRGELVGIDALSRTLFGKAPHGLDTREAAITAALIRAPNAAPRLVAQRACGVWRDMLEAQRSEASTAVANRDRPAPQAPTATPAAPDCGALDLLSQAALQRRAYEPSAGMAPHAARQVLRTRATTARPNDRDAAADDDWRITSTLDADLQRLAVSTLQQQLRELRGRNVNDGAVVVLDNASGDVLAYVGSSGELSAAAEVDAASALRQPGSTLKPLLYAQAIAERRLTAASLLHDAPTDIATQGGLYIPQNYDRHFKGWVSARTALAASLNVPAVRTLAMVSPESFARQLRDFGLALPHNGDYYGFSLALGSAEVSLLALTNAYRTLANGGRQGQPRFLPGTPPAPGAQVIDPRAAFIVADMLSDTNARARTFGTDSVLTTRFWSAVKTGTSKDMRDNWVIGWSQRYTVGVWVGNAEGQAMWDVSGTSGAAPVWATLIRHLHRNLSSVAPTPPPGVVRQAVRFASDPGQPGGEAARQEWFLAGTEQTVFTRPDTAAGAARLTGVPRIAAPVSGTVIALDPDIPPAHQRLTLRAQGLDDPRWRLDDQPLGRGAVLRWLPWPGRHRIELVDASGAVRDSIALEVRGAGTRTP